MTNSRSFMMFLRSVTSVLVPVVMRGFMLTTSPKLHKMSTGVMFIATIISKVSASTFLSVMAYWQRIMPIWENFTIYTIVEIKG